MKTKVIIQSYVPFFIAALSMLSLVSGIILLYAGLYLLGIVCALLAVFGFSYRDGSEIDFKTRKAREFFALGPIRFGDWERIHFDNEFQLRSVRMAYTRSFGGVQPSTYTNSEFKLMLKLYNGKFLLIKRSEKREELELLQTEISDQL